MWGVERCLGISRQQLPQGGSGGSGGCVIKEIGENLRDFGVKNHAWLGSCPENGRRRGCAVEMRIKEPVIIVCRGDEV